MIKYYIEINYIIFKNYRDISKKMAEASEGLFAQNAVKRLTQDDFELESDAPIKLRYKSCMLVLFYGDNIESKNLLQIWNTAGQQVVGPIFASLNLMENKSLAQAFTNLNMQNSALHWAALKTMPFILTYQNRWPIGFYNGERSVQALIDYSLVLACKAEYHEPINLFGGMVASDNLLMQGITQYGSETDPFKKTSLEFTGKENIRNYDPSDKPVLAGTAAEKEESAEVRRKELAAGTEIEEKEKSATGEEIPEDFGGGVRVRPAVPSRRGAPSAGAPEGAPVAERPPVPARRSPPV